MKKRKPKKSSYISFGRKDRRKDGTTTPAKPKDYRGFSSMLDRRTSVADARDSGYGAYLSRRGLYGEDD